MMDIALQGVLPAVVTPLTEDEKLATSAFEKLLERLYAAGSHGLYVCGQTGEGLTLPLAVRKKAAEVAVKNSPAGRAVVVHVGAARTADAVDLARHASAAGAHAISSLPPDSRFSFAETHHYYQTVAEASQVPVLVYYFPEFSSAVRTLGQIDELCSIPKVIGLKFTDFDLYRLSLISRAGRVIFSGRDEVFVAGLLMGACGGIGSFYNLIPELFVEVYQLAGAGKFVEARRVQDRINDLIRAVLRYPMLAALKTLLTWSGIPAGVCAAPRRGLNRDEELQLRKDVEEAGFAPDGFLKA